MVPIVPKQRQFEHSSKPFNDLVSYIEEKNEKEPTQEVTGPFQEVVEYAINPVDQLTSQDKCIGIRTHGISDISNAAIEMNAVAQQNTRCDSPAYHFILSWPEHERPKNEAVFDAAEHAIKALGLGEHQYVIAIHANTDNLHCHIAVNRINPTTFKSRNIEWAHKTLHMAARQSEIKHGWSHDNGIYIVQIDEHGRKKIVFNPDHAIEDGQTPPHAHRELGAEKPLPTWHDPDSLESWLKTKVARELKRDLPALGGWHALHVWLSNYDIKLTDSGGGGMRLRAMSPETGEEFDIAASKGLRLLKRADLEKRWGQFKKPYDIDAVVPDLSHLTPDDLDEGINDVLTRSFDEGIPPHDFLHAQEHSRRHEADRNRRLHELSARGLDAQRSNRGMLVPDALPEHMGDGQAGHDQDLRRAGPDSPGSGSTGSGQGRSIRSLRRDDAKRAERKAERAQARADLRRRFSQYKKFVALGDTGEDGYLAKLKNLRAARREVMQEIRDKANAEKADARKKLRGPNLLNAYTTIGTTTLRRTLQVDADYQAQLQTLRATRLPPLTWREWLFEQSKLGDKAALSALRGIVYQAQRDASRLRKEQSGIEDDANVVPKPEPGSLESPSYREEQFRLAMAQLLEEEKREIAIRAARRNMMRPHEVDALLARYVGINWEITGNGNVRFRDGTGKHLFTDRGSRVTFDRVFVTDQEIQLALAHARQKFGQEITLTGNDPVFTQRMARLADDMGITILNPELQLIITKHRKDRAIMLTSASESVLISPGHPAIGPTQATEGVAPVSAPVPDQPTTPAIVDALQTDETALPAAPIDLPEQIPAQGLEIAPEPVLSPAEHLRALVLAIDPRAQFVVPDPTNATARYEGPIVATLETEGFANHIGRSIYALHPIAAPKDYGMDAVNVRYAEGKAIVTVAHSKDKGKGPGR